MPRLLNLKSGFDMAKSKMEDFVFLAVGMNGMVEAMFRDSQKAVLFCMDNILVFHAWNITEFEPPKLGDIVRV